MDPATATTKKIRTGENLVTPSPAKTPSLANPIQPRIMSPIPIVSPPSDDNLGDIPESLLKSPLTENLDKAMKREVMAASSNSSKSRREIVLMLSSDDDDEDDFDLSKIGQTVASSSPKYGSRNFVYGYMYACKYLWTAHFSKNGPFSSEKVYDKEFQMNLTCSLEERNKRGEEGRNDMSLLCNQLGIYDVKGMRRSKTDNNPKFFRIGSNGRVYFQVLVRVLSKKEVREGKNCESEMMKWLEQIRQAYLASESQYSLQLDMGGVLGRNEAAYRSIDTLLMDADVAEFARIFYRRTIEDGTFLNKPKKVMQFFSVQNAAAAKNLLG